MKAGLWGRGLSVVGVASRVDQLRAWSRLGGRGVRVMGVVSGVNSLEAWFRVGVTSG